MASPARQVARRVDGLALAADFEMQLDAVGVAVAHLGDLLALLHRLVFLHEQRLVMRIGREVGVVVLQDDQVAVAAQTCAGIDDAAVGRREDSVSRLAADVEALVLGVVETREQRTVRRPDPAEVFVARNLLRAPTATP
ncbi:hypothetical protein QFZ47_000842 [Variovorax paradoxus]|nr:hypothetical protein [Variovorax paradoxus]